MDQQTPIPLSLVPQGTDKCITSGQTPAPFQSTSTSHTDSTPHISRQSNKQTPHDLTKGWQQPRSVFRTPTRGTSPKEATSQYHNLSNKRQVSYHQRCSPYEQAHRLSRFTFTKSSSAKSPQSCGDISSTR